MAGLITYRMLDSDTRNYETHPNQTATDTLNTLIDIAHTLNLIMESLQKLSNPMVQVNAETGEVKPLK